MRDVNKLDATWLEYDSGNQETATAPSCVLLERPRMVTTRKKARVSYVEPTEFDNDIGPVKVKSERELVLERQPVALPYIGRPPKTKNTTCHKILELPTDILFVVLAQVHPQTLWAVASASKKLNAFLTSKSARSVWLESFAGAKTYFFAEAAERRELPLVDEGALSTYDYQRDIMGPFRFHYDYDYEYDPLTTPPWDATRRSLASLSESDRTIYNREFKLPLEMPVCPSSVPEFVLARLLYSQACQGCGKDLNNMAHCTTTAWALIGRFCHPCTAARISSIKPLLHSRQVSTRCGEDYQELVNYTTFLLHEPFFSNSRSGVFPNMDERMLYHAENESFTERYEAYKLEKAKKSDSEVAAWLKEKETANVNRMLFGREVQEYAFLSKRVEEQERATIQRQDENRAKEREKSIVDRLCKDHSTPTRAVKLLQQHHKAFQTRLRDPDLLHETIGPLLMAQLKDIVDDFTAWMAENPHWEKALLYNYAFDLYESHVQSHEYNSKLPRLSRSDFWTLSNAKQLVSGAEREDGSTSINIVYDAYVQEIAKLVIKSRLRRGTIRDDLSAKLLERDDDLHHIYGYTEELPRKSSSDTVTTSHSLEDVKPNVEDAELKQQADEEITKLNHFTSIFHCTICQEVVNWKNVCDHLCITNDLAFPNYTAFVNRHPIERCKGIGYQSSRVEAPIEYPLIAAKLVEAVHSLSANREWKYSHFKIPETHHEAADMRGGVWLFECEPDACHDFSCRSRQKGRSRKSFAAMMKHLRERIQVKKLGVTELKIDSIRVFAGWAD